MMTSTALFVIFSVGLSVMVQSRPSDLGIISAFSIIQFENCDVKGTGSINTACTDVASLAVNVAQNNTIGFLGVQFGAGATSILVRLADGHNYDHTEQIDVYLGNPTTGGVLMTTVAGGSTGDPCNFVSTNTFLEKIPSNVNDVYFTFTTDSLETDYIVYLDYFTFNATVT